MSLRGRRAVAQDRKCVELPQARVYEIIDAHGAQEWFKTGFDLRHLYWNCWEPSFWLATRLKSWSRILEPGCGCGLNLLWFAQQRFWRLHGFDNDPKAIAAAKDLGRLAGVRIKYWEDDALAPKDVPSGRYDAILALNWTYLLPEFTVEQFFAIYVPLLSSNGYLVLDVVDPSYADDPRSVYCTQDWERPESERRATEYPTRYSREQLCESAERAGLHHVQTMAQPQHVPKIVYIFRPI